MALWRELGRNWQHGIAAVAEELDADSACLYSLAPEENKLHLFYQQSARSNPPETLDAQDPGIREILCSPHPFSGESRLYGETFFGFHAPYLLASPLALDKRLLGLLVVGRKRSPSARDLTLLSAGAEQFSLLLLLDSYEKEKRDLEKRCASLQQKVAVTYRQLFEANRLTGLVQFAGGIAHEINTPLGAIQTYAEYLELFVSGQAEQESVAGILKAVGHCRDIVQTVSWLSRGNQQKFKPVSLRKVMEEALLLSGPLLRKAGIHLETVYLSSPVVQGNSTALIQVVVNLLTNAREAILRPRLLSRKGEIQVCLGEENDEAFLEISDNGPGIPKEISGQICNPFFTTKEIGSGTGLGLSICSAILEEHQGRLEFSSGEGKGTRTLVKLPLLQNSASLLQREEMNG